MKNKTSSHAGCLRFGLTTERRQSHGNQNTRFIYIRSTKEKVPCTEQQFQDFYRMPGAVSKKEQQADNRSSPLEYYPVMGSIY